MPLSLLYLSIYTSCRVSGAPLKIYGDLFHLLEADDCWEGNEQSMPRLFHSTGALFDMIYLLLVNICVGKEWYRFTSSYFLPGNRFNLTFIDQGPTSLVCSAHSSTDIYHVNVLI